MGRSAEADLPVCCGRNQTNRLDRHFVLGSATVLDFRHRRISFQQFQAEKQPCDNAGDTGNEEEEPELAQGFAADEEAGPRLRAGFTLTPVMRIPKM